MSTIASEGTKLVPGGEIPTVQVDPRWLSRFLKRNTHTSFRNRRKEMRDRAAQPDVSLGAPNSTLGSGTGQPGERSMASTVKAFNALTGHNLTESEGWEFMVLLKLVRGRQEIFVWMIT